MVFFFHMGRSKVVTLCALACIAVIGAGCVRRPGQPFFSSATPTWAIPPSPAESDAPAPSNPKEELKMALDAFKALTSFRATVSLPTKDGVLTGSLDFQKPDRFHATIKTGNVEPIEIIIVKDSLYLRNKEISWIDFSKKSGSKDVSNSLKAALSGDSSLDKLVLGDAAEIKKTMDEDAQCVQYSTTLKTEKGEQIPVDVCVANGLPKRVTMTTAQGAFIVDYHDYNAIFLIERPL